MNQIKLNLKCKIVVSYSFCRLSCFFWLIFLHDPLRLCKHVLPWARRVTLGYGVAQGNASVPDRLNVAGLVEMNW